MPELPEVEIARMELTPCVAGKFIDEVIVGRKQSIRTPADTEKFAQKLQDRRAQKIDRRGKALVFNFDKEITVVFHFKLGAVVLCRRESTPETDGVAWNFKDGTSINFTRLALSEFHLVEKRKLDELPLIKSGINPLARSTNSAKIKELLPPRKQLKAALMDQKIVSGIGNTYSDEILWGARLNPFRKAGELSGAEFEQLTRHIRKTLKESIDAGGEPEFTGPNGRPGRYKLKVHRRAGEPCPHDGHLIEMVKRGRKTFWCPACQK